MKLGDYLTSRGESHDDFAKRASEFRGTRIDQKTIWRVVNDGTICGADIARAIILASRTEPADDGGTVTLDDLVPAPSPNNATGDDGAAA